MILVKFPIFSSSSSSPHDDRTQPVEQLSGVEAVFSVATDIGDDVIEMVEHDALLRHLAATVRTVRLANHLTDSVADLVEKRVEVRLFAVAGDWHVRRDDVEPDVELRILRCLGNGVDASRSRTRRYLACHGRH